jgi:predicted DNA-binding transcriptional regulator AlpA
MARPAWTLTEAVQHTGASRSTLRRYLAAGKFPNAYKDTSNAWRFPLEDLLAAGLSPSESAREQRLNKPNEQAPPANDEQVSRLEQALRDERTRADNAERLAASYLANVEDLRRALVMLEAGSSKPERSSEPVQNVSSDYVKDVTPTRPEQAVSNPEQPTYVLPPGKLAPGPLRALRRLLGR